MEEESYEQKTEEKLAERVIFDEEDQFKYESTISLDETEQNKLRVLTHNEAGECLHTLGKCIALHEYAYLSLDASDRDLTDINVILSFRHVRHVNVSGNRLTSEALRVLEAMPYLQTLRADRNCLISAELNSMPYLQVIPVCKMSSKMQELSLNQNKLRDAAGIHHRLLERLELNHNDICTVAIDPQNLPNLKTLELRGNALVSTTEICCPTLTQLFLAENQIEKIEGLDALVNLRTLHLRNNKLANLDGFTERCHSLKYLNLRNNEISRISELEKLSCLSNLETLIILGNPFLKKEAKEEEEKEARQEYRYIILTILPKLKRIDKDPVLDFERNEVKLR
ncbi:leucine-rich repeat-containing protein 23-like, partial [Pogonomyrmex barbatus]|uniref:Leucine-rich repeat-containing protein 23-like n=1 Tax=Pogonomyrmex barbatus TaxID=144034 RepID=A0A6I9XCZ6_9HYME